MEWNESFKRWEPELLACLTLQRNVQGFNCENHISADIANRQFQSCWMVFHTTVAFRYFNLVQVIFWALLSCKECKLCVIHLLILFYTTSWSYLPGAPNGKQKETTPALSHASTQVLLETLYDAKALMKCSLSGSLTQLVFSWAPPRIPVAALVRNVRNQPLTSIASKNTGLYFMRSCCPM